MRTRILVIGYHFNPQGLAGLISLLSQKIEPAVLQNTSIILEELNSVELVKNDELELLKFIIPPPKKEFLVPEALVDFEKNPESKSWPKEVKNGLNSGRCGNKNFHFLHTGRKRESAK